MANAKEGDKVKIHYKGSFSNGEVFDSSEGKPPLEFTVGEKRVIAGFEKAVNGMAVGETKKVAIPSKDAYGEYIAELVSTVKKSEIPKEIKLQLGMVLVADSGSEGSINVRITEIQEDSLTLDGNHPMAGKDLNFELTLEAIV